MKRRLLIAPLAATLTITGWYFWTRANLPAPKEDAQEKAEFVQLSGGSGQKEDEILRERAELLDPTPLFFPTEWNYGQTARHSRQLREPEQVFGRFDAKLTVSEQNLKSPSLETAVAPPVGFSEVLARANEVPFAGMGEGPVQKSALPIRSAYIEVKDLTTGDVVISQALSGTNAPRPDFEPIEFLVVVGKTGLVGDPFVTSASDSDEVDDFFRRYLVTSYRLGERLRPGRYRVSVGS